MVPSLRRVDTPWFAVGWAPSVLILMLLMFSSASAKTAHFTDELCDASIPPRVAFFLVSLSCNLFIIILLSFILTEEDNPGKWIHPHPQMRGFALRRDFHILVRYPPVCVVWMTS